LRNLQIEIDATRARKSAMEQISRERENAMAEAVITTLYS